MDQREDKWRKTRDGKEWSNQVKVDRIGEEQQECSILRISEQSKKCTAEQVTQNNQRGGRIGASRFRL